MPIENREEYQKKLARAEQIFHAKPGTSEYQELDALVDEIEEYEEREFPI